MKGSAVGVSAGADVAAMSEEVADPLGVVMPP
jgi:hypothetical protein